MKKRLRKKKNLKEFSILGVTFFLKTEFSIKCFDEFLFSFLDFVEKNGLICFGSGTPQKYSLTLESEKPARVVSDFQISLIKEWLAKHSKVIEIKTSEKWDLNYGKFPNEKIQDNFI